MGHVKAAPSVLMRLLASQRENLQAVSQEQSSVGEVV